jgi:hypothetical protein
VVAVRPAAPQSWTRHGEARCADLGHAPDVGTPSTARARFRVARGRTKKRTRRCSGAWLMDVRMPAQRNCRKQGILRRLKDACKEVGITRNVVAYLRRHTFCTIVPGLQEPRDQRCDPGARRRSQGPRQGAADARQRSRHRNDAVHPGVMELRDDKELVLKLFRILNIIVEETITRPRARRALPGSPAGQAEKGMADRAPTRLRVPCPSCGQSVGDPSVKPG